MKPFIINTSSWHYKLIRRFNCNDPSDFCEYTKMLSGSLFISAVLLVCIGAIASMPIDFVYWIVLLTLPGEGAVTLGVPGFIFMVVSVVLGLFKSISVLIDYLHERAKTRKPTKPRKPKPPGFLATWYDTARNKYCIPIEYTDNKDNT